jgi:hypothetical protein
MVAEWTNFSRGAYEDVIATDVRRMGERITSIIKVYN